MANVATITPLNQFFDTNGSPLNSGYLYFGSPNQDPEQFPVQMYWDEAGTVPALQPIRTISGYPSRAGSPAIIYGPDSYALRVRNSSFVQVLYAPSLGGVTISASLAASDGSALVGFIQAGAGAIARTAQAKMRELVSVKDFGATGNGVTDDTAAIQSAITAAAGREVFFPSGTYIVSSVINCPTNTRLRGESRDQSIIRRSATHTGHTMVFGQDVPGLHAGAFGITGLWFFRNVTFNGGSAYIPGTSTSVDNRLTGGQAHIYIHECQRGLIEDSTFQGMPYEIVLSGGSVTTIRENHFSGSIWDQLTATLQEGIAQILFKATAAGGVPTVIALSENDFSGGYPSAVRNVTVGTIVINVAENCGPKFGLLVEACEGVASIGDYYGGHNAHSIYMTPLAAHICTNIKIQGCFFDGSRQDCINFTHADAGGATVLATITGNIFNGETIGQRALAIEGLFSAPSAYSVVFSNNVVMAFLYAPVYIWGGVGIDISDNIISAYNCRGGNTNDAAGSAGAYIVGAGGGVSDKVWLKDNQWGGATNNLSGTNNCQWGAFFGGTFTTGVGAWGDVSNGLGLAGGALVNGGNSQPISVTTFTNSWVNFGGGFNSAAYYKDGVGVVHLQGLIASGVIGSAAFTLPTGFRPAGSCNFGTASNGLFGVCVIDSGGAVIPNIGSNTWFSLEGISFNAVE